MVDKDFSNAPVRQNARQKDADVQKKIESATVGATKTDLVWTWIGEPPCTEMDFG